MVIPSGVAVPLAAVFIEVVDVMLDAILVSTWFSRVPILIRVDRIAI